MPQHAPGGVEQGYGRKSAEATGMMEGDRAYQGVFPTGKIVNALEGVLPASKEGHPTKDPEYKGGNPPSSTTTPMLLRVRGPGGQSTLKLEPDATVAALKALLEQQTGVPAAQQEERWARAEQEWARKPAAQRTAAAAQQIGKDCGITAGKWMVRTTPDDEAVVWGAVARAVYVQGLCASAKISAGPQGGRAHQKEGQRVICVYTDDFSDKEDALRVHAGLSAALRAALPQRAKWATISYKPDIYTNLGLYYGNADGIKPTIYSKKL
ncbi:UPF0696 C11orf68-like protein [Chlorella sorokiniana]|uniref:UPF0696 C11orf68-like protein n=1 Tax=Chlorella sorokiniana TaxID=3076 RepID=A0A2P6TGW9_CHLSO|nr:UPF0696 C11orf68-like protein [Chlorella sorokiniana]|eukprot:PRW33537.1 UPF0696 C11orf68-like protein [Chlorella sorokiniana]